MEELNPPLPAQPPRQSARRRRIQSAHRTYILLVRTMHRTILSVLAHDCLNLGQSVAYSAIVALFPTLMVAAAVIGLLPYTTPLRFQLAMFFDRILPPGVNPLLDVYFQNTPKNTHSIRALVSAGIVSFLGASNVMATIMEGLRRARNLPANYWTFWERRRRAFALVFLSLVPLAVASLLVVFGHTVTSWLASSISPDVRRPVYAVALLVRWSVALGASVGLIAIIYHLGVPAKRPRATQHPMAPPTWVSTLPGAIVATAAWFMTTLAFGWYVTRFANYSEVYGSLGTGIALLFWLYIVSLCVLCGAEFNVHFRAHLATGSAVMEEAPSPPVLNS